MVADFNNSRIFIIDLATNSLTGTISTASTDYEGHSTIAVAPGSDYALASGVSPTLVVIQAPFEAGSAIATVDLPGLIPSYQTQAIVFDNASKRAFVYHTTGISVLNPPYTTIDFTIPFDNETTGLLAGGAIAITPDGQTLLTTTYDGNVYIFKAPFSTGTTPETLAIDATPKDYPKLGVLSQGVNPLPDSVDEYKKGKQALLLNGINITPNGNTALVSSGASGDTATLHAISAPFSSTSTVEEIPLPPALAADSFEDIGISPDGQLAILSGGSVDGSPAAFIRAPFTAAGAEVFAVDIIGGGRGAGSVRFFPTNT